MYDSFSVHSPPFSELYCPRDKNCLRQVHFPRRHQNGPWKKYEDFVRNLLYINLDKIYL